MIDLVTMSSKIFEEYDPLLRCEYAARVCYNSTGAIKPGTAKPFLQRRLEEGHTSVFEHTRVLVNGAQLDLLAQPDKSRAEQRYRDQYHASLDRFSIDGNAYLHQLAENLDVDLLAKQEPDPAYFSVEFICSRYIANQIRTHRTLSYGQESLRYVDKVKSLQVVRPDPDYNNGLGWCEWIMQCEQLHKTYQTMRLSGISKESARGILPLDTKTRIFVSGTPYWWCEFLRKRSDDAAQAQLRYLLGTLAVQEKAMIHFDTYHKAALPYLEKLKKFYESVNHA